MGRSEDENVITEGAGNMFPEPEPRAAKARLAGRILGELGARRWGLTRLRRRCL